jgi:hypothetical protein
MEESAAYAIAAALAGPDDVVLDASGSHPDFDADEIYDVLVSGGMSYSWSLRQISGAPAAAPPLLAAPSEAVCLVHGVPEKTSWLATLWVTDAVGATGYLTTIVGDSGIVALATNGTVVNVTDTTFVLDGNKSITAFDRESLSWFWGPTALSVPAGVEVDDDDATSAVLFLPGRIPSAVEITLPNVLGAYEIPLLLTGEAEDGTGLDSMTVVTVNLHRAPIANATLTPLPLAALGPWCPPPYSARLNATAGLQPPPHCAL